VKFVKTFTKNSSSIIGSNNPVELHVAPLINTTKWPCVTCDEFKLHPHNVWRAF